MSNASSPGRAYPAIIESTVEAAALHWLEGLGWNVAHGPDIAPDTPGAEGADYGQVFLQRRLMDALALTANSIAAVPDTVANAPFAVVEIGYCVYTLSSFAQFLLNSFVGPSRQPSPNSTLTNRYAKSARHRLAARSANCR